jgi:poly(A) polymerase
MNDLAPHQPIRPLIWPDIVTRLQNQLERSQEIIFIVGGAVRDAWLHRPFHDLDLAVSGDALRLARHIANELNGDYFAMDNERGVGRVLLDTLEGRLRIDVSRFRAATLHDDLKDRDFTINAMAVDLRGDLNLLIDPLNGESDMTNKIIRRCSPSALKRDPVRTLRAIRQSIQFGMRIEPETLQDIRASMPLLKHVSPERIRDELFNLLSLRRVAAAVRIADMVGLLQVIFPETASLHTVQLPSLYATDRWQHTLLVIENLTGVMAAISSMRTDNSAASFGFGMIAIALDRYRQQLQTHLNLIWPNERPHRALLMLTALLNDVATTPADSAEKTDTRLQEDGLKAVDSRVESLRLSNAERQRIILILQNKDRVLDLEGLTSIDIHRYWRRTGEAGIDACLLALADYLGTYGAQIQQDNWLKLVERVQILLEAYFDKRDQLIFPPTLVDGNQLISKLGLRPGPAVGQLLDAIREAQVEGQVKTAEDALNLAKSLLDEKKV